jgi:hypothetical protein
VTRILHDLGHLGQQPGQAPFGPQIQDHPCGKPAEHTQHDEGNEGNHQHLGPVVVKAANDKTRREQMDQLHHQQAGQQCRQQVEYQGENKASRHQQPGSDLIAGGRRHRGLGHGRHSAKKSVTGQGLPDGEPI